MDKAQEELTDKMGKLTIVTPPSMIRPKDISFTIINLNDEQKTVLTCVLYTSDAADDA